MRSAISWIHWSGKAFNISAMILEGLCDFLDFIFCINEDIILPVVNGTEPVEGSV